MGNQVNEFSYSAHPVTNAAYTTLIESTQIPFKEILVTDTSGKVMEVAIGGNLHQATFAMLTDQGVLYAAQDAGSAGNDITITLEDPGAESTPLSVNTTGTDIVVTLESDADVKASRIIQDLTYTAQTAGVGGNAISLTYTDPVTPASLSVNTVGNAITVNLERLAATHAIGTLDLTTDITLTSVAAGSARNTTTFKTVVHVAAANPTDTVLAAFTGTASAIVCTITPNDGTNNAATPVDLTTAELAELISTGAVVGKTVTVTDSSSLRILQTATGGDATDLANGGEGDNVTATFSGGANSALSSTATQIKALIDGDVDASALVAVAVTGTGSNIQTAQVQTFLQNGRAYMLISTAQDVVDLINNDVDASALILATAESPANVLAPLTQTNLDGGSDESRSAERLLFQMPVNGSAGIPMPNLNTVPVGSRIEIKSLSTTANSGFNVMTLLS